MSRSLFSGNPCRVFREGFRRFVRLHVLPAVLPSLGVSSFGPTLRLSSHVDENGFLRRSTAVYPDMEFLVGAKAAALAGFERYLKRLGMTDLIPPWFVLPITSSRDDLPKRFVQAHKAAFEKELADLNPTGPERFGDPIHPMLVAVRASNRAVRPGRYDTLLNVGITDVTLPGLERELGVEHARFLYLKLIRKTAVVLGADEASFPHDEESFTQLYASRTSLEIQFPNLLAAYKQRFYELTREQFPQDPYDQLDIAVRAAESTARSGIVDSGVSIRNAVMVMPMVYGSFEESMSGAASSRDPKTGEPNVDGTAERGVQGDDTHDARGLDLLREMYPHTGDALNHLLHWAENYLKDVATLEFVIEKRPGQTTPELKLLQIRPAERSLEANARVTFELFEKDLITEREMRERLEGVDLEPLKYVPIAPSQVPGGVTNIGHGKEASPGAAIGMVVTTLEEAQRLRIKGIPRILVKGIISKEDEPLLQICQGAIALKAFNWHVQSLCIKYGIPAIVGVDGYRFSPLNGIAINNHNLRPEETILLISQGQIVTPKQSKGHDFTSLRNRKGLLEDFVVELLCWQARWRGVQPIIQVRPRYKEIASAITNTRNLTYGEYAQVIHLDANKPASIAGVIDVLDGSKQTKDMQKRESKEINPFVVQALVFDVLAKVMQLNHFVFSLWDTYDNFAERAAVKAGEGKLIQEGAIEYSNLAAMKSAFISRVAAANLEAFVSAIFHSFDRHQTTRLLFQSYVIKDFDRNFAKTVFAKAVHYARTQGWTGDFPVREYQVARIFSDFAAMDPEFATLVLYELSLPDQTYVVNELMAFYVTEHIYDLIMDPRFADYPTMLSVLRGLAAANAPFEATARALIGGLTARVRESPRHPFWRSYLDSVRQGLVYDQTLGFALSELPENIGTDDWRVDRSLHHCPIFISNRFRAGGISMRAAAAVALSALLDCVIPCFVVSLAAAHRHDLTRAPRVRLEAFIEGDRAVFELRSDGRGMAESDVPRFVSNDDAVLHERWRAFVRELPNSSLEWQTRESDGEKSIGVQYDAQRAPVVNEVTKGVKDSILCRISVPLPSLLEDDGPKTEFQRRADYHRWLAVATAHLSAIETNRGLNFEVVLGVLGEVTLASEWMMDLTRGLPSTELFVPARQISDLQHRLIRHYVQDAQRFEEAANIANAIQDASQRLAEWRGILRQVAVVKYPLWPLVDPVRRAGDERSDLIFDVVKLYAAMDRADYELERIRLALLIKLLGPYERLELSQQIKDPAMRSRLFAGQGDRERAAPPEEMATVEQQSYRDFLTGGSTAKRLNVSTTNESMDYLLANFGAQLRTVAMSLPELSAACRRMLTDFDNTAHDLNELRRVANNFAKWLTMKKIASTHGVRILNENEMSPFYGTLWFHGDQLFTAMGLGGLLSNEDPLGKFVDFYYWARSEAENYCGPFLVNGVDHFTQSKVAAGVRVTLLSANRRAEQLLTRAGVRREYEEVIVMGKKPRNDVEHLMELFLLMMLPGVAKKDHWVFSDNLADLKAAWRLGFTTVGVVGPLMHVIEPNAIAKVVEMMRYCTYLIGDYNSRVLEVHHPEALPSTQNAMDLIRWNDSQEQLPMPFRDGEWIVLSGSTLQERQNQAKDMVRQALAAGVDVVVDVSGKKLHILMSVFDWGGVIAREKDVLDRAWAGLLHMIENDLAKMDALDISEEDQRALREFFQSTRGKADTERFDLLVARAKAMGKNVTERTHEAYVAMFWNLVTQIQRSLFGDDFNRWVYPAAEAYLDELHRLNPDHPCFVVSKNPDAPFKAHVGSLHVGKHFRGVQGRPLESELGRVWGKAEALRELVRTNGVRPEDVVFWEDRPEGIKSGADAGVNTIGVARSYEQAVKLIEAGADLMTTSFEPRSALFRAMGIQGHVRQPQAWSIATSAVSQAMVLFGGSRLMVAYDPKHTGETPAVQSGFWTRLIVLGPDTTLRGLVESLFLKGFGAEFHLIRNDPTVDLPVELAQRLRNAA